MSEFLLEVIVTSAADAVEAEAGGADRLELVSELEHGGLTPSVKVTREVLKSVSLPVRVMVRESRHMAVETPAEVQRLKRAATRLSELGIDGLVIGFTRDGRLDLETTGEILGGAQNVRATFHRASDFVPDGQQNIAALKRVAQIDRVLTNGGAGTWEERRARLESWREVCAPNVRIIFAAGNDIERVPGLIQDTQITEIHIGRAVRDPQTAAGRVVRDRVARLRKTFAAVQ